MTILRCWTNQRTTPRPLGRDENPREEGGHSPEYHTVVLETTDELQRQRISQTRGSKARPHNQQTTLL